MHIMGNDNVGTLSCAGIFKLFSRAILGFLCRGF